MDIRRIFGENYNKPTNREVPKPVNLRVPSTSFSTNNQPKSKASSSSKHPGSQSTSSTTEAPVPYQMMVEKSKIRENLRKVFSDVKKAYHRADNDPSNVIKYSTSYWTLRGSRDTPQGHTQCLANGRIFIVPTVRKSIAGHSGILVIEGLISISIPPESTAPSNKLDMSECVTIDLTNNPKERDNKRFNSDIIRDTAMSIVFDSNIYPKEFVDTKPRDQYCIKCNKQAFSTSSYMAVYSHKPDPVNYPNNTITLVHTLHRESPFTIIEKLSEYHTKNDKLACAAMHVRIRLPDDFREMRIKELQANTNESSRSKSESATAQKTVTNQYNVSQSYSGEASTSAAARAKLVNQNVSKSLNVGKSSTSIPENTNIFQNTQQITCSCINQYPVPTLGVHQFDPIRNVYVAIKLCPTEMVCALEREYFSTFAEVD